MFNDDVKKINIHQIKTKLKEIFWTYKDLNKS